ncbi:MAG: hypothetical protein IIC90_06410 [Chloroflexi bacterium]|nr:hypothetical protein [Chloroflexota bacterium]
MSVDTYLKRKNLAPYLAVDHEGVKIFVAPKLIQWAQAVHLEVKQFLIWKSFQVFAEHKHAPT